MIYWLGYSDAKTIDTYMFDFNLGNIFWNRLNKYYPNSMLWGNTISFKEPI